MFDAAFQHIRTTANVGDRACCPADYFDFGTSTIGDFGADLPACHRAILGGGQVAQQAINALIYNAAAARHTVIWAVGLDSKTAQSLPFEIARASASLISTRNAGVAGLSHVPCVSAMSPLFDAPPAPKHEVVAFLHHRKSTGITLPDSIPSLTNHGPTLQQAIAHIASGDTVVTNSYHGTYWAMLLGRRTLCLPFSNKFNGFADPPTMATPSNWQTALPKARRHPALLEQARTANRGFFDKVMNL
ncbi:polysaccharide pyruvyl transferase family protein [Rhodobacteraceae bacterium D3-12]|nr:polysaccharide pyruvyl transferase family protein [Rhodobacteraceae bacterium D3-12]